MNTVHILSKSAEQTLRLGERLARHFKKGDVVCLQGDLGSGKTTLIKGIAKGLNVNPVEVNSPTFVLMNAYQGRRPARRGGLPMYHFDLYRLENTAQIGALGYEEFFYGDGICVIEWAERLGVLTPKEYLRVELKHKGENERSIKFSAVGKHYSGILESGMFLNPDVTRSFRARCPDC